MQVDIGERILSAHDEVTTQNKKLLSSYGIFTINIMGSPGAGKTAMLEKLIDQMKPFCRIGVIEGDLFTTKDAQRIEAQGVPVVQINTRGACHLDGNMIDWALKQLPLNNIDLLIIENIGNLICPAEFDLGEDMRISILSVTEGEDKVPKYPLMFQDAAAIILNKIDLLPYTTFNTNEFYSDIRSLNPNGTVFEVSCTAGAGIDQLAEWLKGKMVARKGMK
jgi:hydrogenase nickel incorporation protein HypB